jgi:hypothetical protein
MSLRQLHLLSPYRMPTTYPLQLSGDEAASWLNGYLALWHPAALALGGQAPIVSNTYDHDTPGPGYVYCVPQGPHLYQPDDWAERVAAAHAVKFAATSDRAESIKLLKEALRDSNQAGPLIDAPDDTVRLFAALGIGYLLVDSLFDAMDHEKLLDPLAFWADVSAAVEALASGGSQPPDAEPVSFEVHLKAAAEKLQVAREQLFSGSLYWLDFALVNPKELGAAWPDSLQKNVPLTLLAAGEDLERLAEQEPERFAELKSKIIPGLPPSVDIACGSYRERDEAFLPFESQLWNLREARRTVKTLFDVDALSYARQKSAYHPQLPSWLHHLGFKHAVLVSFDSATIPSLRGTAANWPGPDGKAVDAFTRSPLPAHDPHTFFNLVYHLREAVSQDAAPTIAFIHKGQPPFDAYRDLLALADLGPVLGNWIGLSRYFTDAVTGDYIGSQSADDFFADYLDDRVTNGHRPDAVSAYPRHLRLRRRLDSAFTLAALHTHLTPNDAADLKPLEKLETEIELRGVELPEAATDALSEALTVQEDAIAKRLAERLQGRAEPRPGFMILNPCSFTRRAALELDGARGALPLGDAIKASEFENGVSRVVVEVPPLGYVWIPRDGSGSGSTKHKFRTAEGLTVRNEFFEADVDAATGSLRSFRDYRTRVTRFGHQLVFNPGSKPKVTSIKVTNAGTALGEIVSEGELIGGQDEVLATFRQRYRAWVGRPVLELKIELDIKHEPTGYPWHGYYGARFGWRDDRGVLFRGVNGQNTQTGYTRPVSPDYLEVRFGAERSFLFTGGLPFIQRHGSRMADVILVPEGEKARSFELLLSLDRELPMQTAAGWVSPTPVVPTEKGPPAAGAVNWLGHVDMPSLILTSLRPCAAGEGMNRAVVGQFLETSGFGGTAEFRFVRDANQVSLVDCMGEPVQPLTMNGDAIPLDYSAGETLRVKAEWL